MNLGQAYRKYPFVRASRTRAGFGQPEETQSFHKFINVLKKDFPAVHEKIRKIKPELLSYEGRALYSTPLPGLGNNPRIYSYQFGQVEPSILPEYRTPGIAPEPAKTSWGQQLLEIGQGVLTVWQQQELFKTQVKRAEKGLPPIDVETMAIPIKMELPEEVEKEITVGTRQITQTLTWLIPLGILGFFMLRPGR